MFWDSQKSLKTSLFGGGGEGGVAPPGPGHAVAAHCTRQKTAVFRGYPPRLLEGKIEVFRPFWRGGRGGGSKIAKTPVLAYPGIGGGTQNHVFGRGSLCTFFGFFQIVGPPPPVSLPPLGG